MIGFGTAVALTAALAGCATPGSEGMPRATPIEASADPSRQPMPTEPPHCYALNAAPGTFESQVPDVADRAAVEDAIDPSTPPLETRVLDVVCSPGTVPSSAQRVAGGIIFSVIFRDSHNRTRLCWFPDEVAVVDPTTGQGGTNQAVCSNVRVL